jgi:hypothetical protein
MINHNVGLEPRWPQQLPVLKKGIAQSFFFKTLEETEVLKKPIDLLSPNIKVGPYKVTPTG